MRILLLSDVHLDSAFAWARREVARRRRQGLRDALAAGLRLALDLRADVICCGGDLFEHDRVSPDTGPFLRGLFERVHPIPVFISPGNHDWLGPESLYGRIAWTSNVHVFREGRLTAAQLDDGVTLWGAAHRAPAGAPNFLDGFRVDRSGLNLAMFHGSELTSMFGEDPDKQPHAPFRVEQIERAGLSFALLGHYHSPRDTEWFTYPGNPDPLTFGESGQRGAVIATVGSDGRVSLERHSIAVSDVGDIRLEVTGCASHQDIRDRVTAALAGRQGCIRVTLTGDLASEIDLQSTDFNDLANHDTELVVRFECVTVENDLAQIAKEPTVRGQFIRDVLASGLSPDLQKRVIATGMRALDGRSDLEVL